MQATDRPLRIDIVVHGRFHAFHLARHLIAQGHDVHVLTNYPKFAVRRFGIESKFVRNCVWHGILLRLGMKLSRIIPWRWMEPTLHRMFGRWVVHRARRDAHAIHVFSGVAEELFQALHDVSPRPLLTLVRGSSHIHVQARLLEEEEVRVGYRVDRPSVWMVQREVREYALADRVVTLSTFAQNSFVAEGVPPEKIWMMPLGVDVARFYPQDMNERLKRIREGDKLKVLMVGSFSARKGALDYIEIARSLQGRMHFRFVGDIPPQDEILRQQAGDLIEFVPRVPEHDLPAQYSWGDVFCFPTIEDGFAVVLAQAQATGLPILTTPNSSGPDFVTESENGWVLPIRSPQDFVERLQWCDVNREVLSEMVESLQQNRAPRTWGDVARQFAEAINQERCVGHD